MAGILSDEKDRQDQYELDAFDLIDWLQVNHPEAYQAVRYLHFSEVCRVAREVWSREKGSLDGQWTPWANLTAQDQQEIRRSFTRLWSPERMSFRKQLSEGKIVWAALRTSYVNQEQKGSPI